MIFWIMVVIVVKGWRFVLFPFFFFLVGSQRSTFVAVYYTIRHTFWGGWGEDGGLVVLECTINGYGI